MKCLVLFFNRITYDFKTIESYGIEIGYAERFDQIVDTEIYDAVLIIFDGKSYDWLSEKMRDSIESLPTVIMTPSIDDDLLDRAIRHGIDDVVKNDIEPKHLVLKLRSLYRLEVHFRKSIDLRYEYQRGEVIIDNMKVKLTKTENMVFNLLHKMRLKAVSRDEIIDHIWGPSLSATDNTLAIHISRLRNKLRHQHTYFVIETVRGYGYRLSV